jgi:DNA-binding NarL/FixJ family response regulator
MIRIISLSHLKDITDLKKTEELLKTENNILEKTVEKRTLDLIKANEKLKWEILEHNESEKALKKSKGELQKQRKALKQKNSALSEIIAQIEKEKDKIKDSVITNINTIIFPTIEKLRLQKDSEIYIKLLESQLKDITSQYGTKINRNHNRLTPREIELCNFIKSGLSSKEIAHLLNISLKTVNKHRRNIRKKLDLTNNVINLITYLSESV